MPSRIARALRSRIRGGRDERGRVPLGRHHWVLSVNGREGRNQRVSHTGQSHNATQGGLQWAPGPVNIAGIVSSKIRRSANTEQVRTYSRPNVARSGYPTWERPAASPSAGHSRREGEKQWISGNRGDPRAVMLKAARVLPEMVNVPPAAAALSVSCTAGCRCPTTATTAAHIPTPCGPDPDTPPVTVH